MLRVGAPTVSVKPWPVVNGPVPVLLSVAVATRLKLPAALTVPLTVTLVAVVPPTLRPAGRPVTVKPL